MVVAGKTIRFWRNYARTDPAHMPMFLARRVQERLRTAPTGMTEIAFRDVRLPLDMSIHVLMAKYYFKTHEMFLERVYRKFLNTGQVFLDVGANCGYWSAFAADLVGATGQVHMFEPVDRYFANLVEFARLNTGYTLIPSQTAIGAEPGVGVMDVVKDDLSNFGNYMVNTGSNSLLTGFLTDESLTVKHNVSIIKLDDYVAAAGIDASTIGLIKVDVEGFESFVLNGMPKLLSRTPRIPLLVEVVTAPERNEVLEGKRVVAFLRGYGYVCLDATTMKPIDPHRMGLEENIVCV